VAGLVRLAVERYLEQVKERNPSHTETDSSGR
jgi:hypothetical protein